VRNSAGTSGASARIRRSTGGPPGRPAVGGSVDVPTLVAWLVVDHQDRIGPRSTRRSAASWRPIVDMPASVARATVASMRESCASAVEPQQPAPSSTCATHREVERHYREARILGIGGGTTEIMNEIIAELFGLWASRFRPAARTSVADVTEIDTWDWTAAASQRAPGRCTARSQAARPVSVPPRRVPAAGK
jgi:hypothetical protein